MGFFNKMFGKKSMQSVPGNGLWTSIIHEPFTGAWQQNKELKREDLLTFHAVFTCISLISKDIGKLPLQLKKQVDGVWIPIKDKKFKYLEKPNHFQTLQQFLEYWMVSKLTRGNTYVLKFRNFLGEIEQLLVLNPDIVIPLIDDFGNVFYQIGIDRLSKQQQSVILPASEIIHDRWNCFYHPLVGLSPITACAMGAKQGLAIQNFSAGFFNNMSRPSGILVAPGKIDPDDAKAIQTAWNANYGSGNVGKTAILGGDMKYLALSMPASDAQLIEQHKLSAEICCSAFNVPPFKAGVASLPQGQKVEDMNLIYLGDCLQSPIDAIENLLDDALGLKVLGYEAFFDLDALVRMDSASQMNFFGTGVQRGIFAPNEARAKFGYKPVAGGEVPYMQQQNYNLEALAKRDAKDDPFSTSKGSKDDAADSE